MDEPENFGYLLVDTSRLFLRSFARRAAPLGVNLAQSKALGYLARNPGVTQVQLAELTDIAPMTLGRILDRMELDGWIQRRACSADRRARSVYLKPGARRLFAELGALAAQVRAQAIAGVSERKRAIFVDVLAHLYGNLALPEAGTGAVASARGRPRPPGTAGNGKRKIPAVRAGAVRAATAKTRQGKAPRGR